MGCSILTFGGAIIAATGTKIISTITPCALEALGYSHPEPTEKKDPNSLPNRWSKLASYPRIAAIGGLVGFGIFMNIFLSKRPFNP